ncbi:MAG: tRNA pseudouridine(55) synthase TruB [Clostridiales bacterium]|nr:tRNA pseudouridine(55) synthase TruB [Clostridiales bacterium]
MELSGVLILNKPAGMTSHDCVNKIRRLYNTKKVGHTGTLDPDATGVLPILIGRAAKAADFLSAEDKVYRAGLKLGITTDTEDTSGQILTQSDDIPPEAKVRAVCDSFVGDIMQVPPMYSALKVGGQKLVDLARRGITVEREARPIKIFSIDTVTTDKADEYILTVHCSKGTYIRTLCADIGAKCGCGGAMCSLVRERSGGFSLDESVTLDELEAMDMLEREKLLRPVEKLFSNLPKVYPAPFFEKLSRDGNEIYQKKIGTDFPTGTRVRLYGKGGFYALGEVGDYPDGSAIKVIKLFLL